MLAWTAGCMQGVVGLWGDRVSSVFNVAGNNIIKRSARVERSSRICEIASRPWVKAMEIITVTMNTTRIHGHAQLCNVRRSQTGTEMAD